MKVTTSMCMCDTVTNTSQDNIIYDRLRPNDPLTSSTSKQLHYFATSGNSLSFSPSLLTS